MACVKTHHTKSLYSKTILSCIFSTSFVKIGKGNYRGPQNNPTLSGGQGLITPNHAKDKRADYKDFEPSVERRLESTNKEGKTPVLTTSDGFNARPQGTCGNKAVTEYHMASPFVNKLYPLEGG